MVDDRRREVAHRRPHKRRRLVPPQVSGGGDAGLHVHLGVVDPGLEVQDAPLEQGGRRPPVGPQVVRRERHQRPNC